MSSPEHTFTVFTASYNRAHTLPRVYESLCRQTFEDLEWIVVDDGSTDGTAELVEAWKAEAPFPIRLFRQANGGKCRAVNRGVAESRAEFFVNLDSDDACVPEALERLLFHWGTIPEERRAEFSSVAALAMDESGRIVGDRFPEDPTDSDPLEIRFCRRVRGDKWGFHRTEVMREFPFPVIEGEKYMADGLVWNRIAARYRTRYVNEPLRIYHATPGSWGSSVGPRARNPCGYVLYYAELFKTRRELPFDVRMRNAINYARFSFHADYRVSEQLRDAAPRRAYWILAVVPGWLLHRRDRLQAKAPQ